MLFMGLMIPFAGTAAGSAAVFFMKNKSKACAQALLSGFAAGVMVAASVWSLLIPSIEMTEGGLRFLPASIGLVFGVIILILLDSLASRFYEKREKERGIKKTAMLITAVTLHNIPEGMAVGVSLAAALNGKSEVELASALALSVGIAIQNIPEGAIISMPLKAQGKPKYKAFFGGVMSGIVEPVFGFLTVLFTKTVQSAMPYLLAFAAGAMLFVVVDELIPEAKQEKRSYALPVGFTAGFTVMMILDVCFG